MRLTICVTVGLISGVFWGGAAYACTDRYEIKPGDTLAQIADREMGSVFAAQNIHDANRAVIGASFGDLPVGTVLSIPCKGSAQGAIDWSIMPSAVTLAALTILGDVQILDIRSAADLADGVIPGAVSIPFARWRGPENNPGEPPSEERLEQMLGDAGLRLDAPIIIVHDIPEPMDIGRAALVYWILKSSGAEKLAILRNGFQSWEKADLPVADAPFRRPPVTVDVTFSSKWRADQLEVFGIATNQIPGHLLDARPHDLFSRLDAIGHAVRTTLPGASNAPVIPLMSVLAGEVDVEDGVDTVISYLADKGVDWTEGPVVSFCDTGELAAVNWFYASELAGLDNMVLYPESVYGWENNGGRLFVGGPDGPQG